MSPLQCLGWILLGPAGTKRTASFNKNPVYDNSYTSKYFYRTNRQTIAPSISSYLPQNAFIITLLNLWI